jgi:UDP:flavonoid glycosyltransferase YjiC (YdhE family)
MRALFTVQPSVGHLHPLIPVANALSDAGHEVAVCSSSSFRSEVEAFGLEHLGAGLDWHTSDRSTWKAFPPMPPPGPEFAKFVVTMFADITARHMVPDLLAIAGGWKPDLVIREGMEYGGCIVAECLGIPHASIAGNGFAAVDSPQVDYFPGNRRMVAAPLARHREEFGLPPDPEVEMPFRFLHLCFTPPSWDGTSVPRPQNAHFLRHTSTVAPGARVPDWASDLPDRPTVLVSLGTVFNTHPGVLEAIIDGLRDEPVNLIVSIGRDRDADDFGAQPANVRLEHYMPQPLLLPRCSVFVNHGGFNGVKEALSEAVPMVVVPITADQPYCAERCAALGVARVVDAGNRTAEWIRASVLDVLQDPGYARKASEFRAEMDRLPGLDHVVGLLEALQRQRSEPISSGKEAS